MFHCVKFTVLSLNLDYGIKTLDTNFFRDTLDQGQNTKYDERGVERYKTGMRGNSKRCRNARGIEVV